MSILDTNSQRSIIARFVGSSGISIGRDEENDDDRHADNQDAEPLSAEDAVCAAELEYMEQAYLSYSQSPLNVATLRLNSQCQSDSLLVGDDIRPLELETLLGYLPPALPSTKKLEYQARGYETLLRNVEKIQCSSDHLDRRRVELGKLASIELDRLLSAVTQELKEQASVGTHYDGLRRIKFVSSSNRDRYISPVVSACVVLIAIIHCMMGVARDHCNLILKCLRCILQLAANMQDARAHIFASNHIDPIPTTLPTALLYLGLLDSLDTYVVCAACDSLYKEDGDTEIPAQCSYINLDGILCSTELFIQQYRGNRSWRTPLRRFSHETLECWLCRFLSRPEIEDLLESTCPLNQEPCTDVWGAWYLSNFPGNGKPNFFECPAEELRLVFLVFHDFFNPFTNKIAGKQRSIGLIMMVCLNLPPDVRYDMKNIYVTAMLPGPKEPTLDNINKFLKPIMDNLCEHYNPGVYISSTHKYPRGRKVRSAAAVTSMDMGACRAFAGIGSHSHTCFCSFCTATLSEIDDFDLSHFSVRSMDDHAAYVNSWTNAPSLEARKEIWSQHGVRYSEWSRNPWYNPFTDTLIGPLHWQKNVLEKQIRENMGCGTKKPSGIPSAPPLSRLITTVGINWGYQAMLYSSHNEFAKTKFPEPLLRYMCRDKGIFEAGVASDRMTLDLNKWHQRNNLLDSNGNAIASGPSHAVAMAKAEYYLSRSEGKVTPSLSSGSTMEGLWGLCERFKLPYSKKTDKKADLMKRLVEHYSKNEKVFTIPEPPRPETEGPILGTDRVTEIKADMRRTNLPSWLKKPPVNFATADHGKLASEEYKSLALVSLPITLIRLRVTATPETQEYFDHFLHLSAVVQILSYMSHTDHDIGLLDYHNHEYVNKLKHLYPFNSITPVQHLGLHLPYFLRKLGPSTRYSESTCEMFIGMLEEMTTNSRIGQLEQTLHRELIMAANLKATTDKWNFSEVLRPFSDVIGDFLDRRYAGSERPSSTTWSTKRKSGITTLDLATHEALSLWTRSNNIRNFTRRLHICEQLRRGHVVYQSFTESRNESPILFQPLGDSTPIPGRIEAILQEPEDANSVFEQSRIIVLARAFKPLTLEDAGRDPYRNHRIFGVTGLNMMGLVYDTLDLDRVHIIEPNNIISHTAVCPFEDSTSLMSAPCLVVRILDFKHAFHS